MYSVVLMAALATSSSAPEFGHHGCGGGAYGGGYANGCGCYGGYTTWCSGVNSPYFGPPYGGSYYGRGAYGVYGAYGAQGQGAPCYPGPSPYGSWNPSGVGYGYSCYGYYTGWTCFGQWGPSPYNTAGGYGTTACYGGFFGPGPVPPCAGMPTPDGVGSWPWTDEPTPPVTPPELVPDPKKKIEHPSPARVRVETPADAKVYLDGVLMKSGSAVRYFRTPELTPALTYAYEVRAEVVRHNQTFTETRRVLLRAGQQTTASFADLERRAAAAAPAVQSAQR